MRRGGILQGEWGLLTGMLGIVVLPPVVLMILEREPAIWKGQYYRSPDFSGQPVVRRDRDPGLDRRPGLPPEVRDAETFSVRWETVLDAGEGGVAAFMLTSKGGSRLLLNGRTAIDNRSGPLQFRHTRGFQTRLPAGRVRITVEHVVATERPFLALSASFDGEPPRRIDPERLRHPGDGNP